MIWVALYLMRLEKHSAVFNFIWTPAKGDAYDEWYVVPSSSGATVEETKQSFVDYQKEELHSRNKPLLYALGGGLLFSLLSTFIVAWWFDFETVHTFLSLMLVGFPLGFILIRFFEAVTEHPRYINPTFLQPAISLHPSVIAKAPLKSSADKLAYWSESLNNWDSAHQRFQEASKAVENDSHYSRTGATVHTNHDLPRLEAELQLAGFAAKRTAKELKIVLTPTTAK